MFKTSSGNLADFDMDGDYGANDGDTLTLVEGQTAVIWLQPTFPLTTGHCFQLAPNNPCQPKYTFSIHSQLSVSTCQAVLISPNTRSNNFTVSPVTTIGLRDSSFIQEVDFYPYHTITDRIHLFEGYTIFPIYVSWTVLHFISKLLMIERVCSLVVRMINYWCWRQVIVLWLGWLIIGDGERW